MSILASLSILHAKLAALCPIDGISIGKLADTSTWRIDFSASATAQQIAAAQAFIANITPVKLLLVEAALQNANSAVPDPIATARQNALTTLS